eukprot:3805198-Rhodomonas_salina.1
MGQKKAGRAARSAAIFTATYRFAMINSFLRVHKRSRTVQTISPVFPPWHSEVQGDLRIRGKVTFSVHTRDASSKA